MSFDTATGRWMEQDPAGYIDGPNPYQFADSNPISFLDTGGELVVDGPPIPTPKVDPLGSDPLAPRPQPTTKPLTAKDCPLKISITYAGFVAHKISDKDVQQTIEDLNNDNSDIRDAGQAKLVGFAKEDPS